MSELLKSGEIQLTQSLLDELTQERQAFIEESKRSDKQFDKGNQTQYYIVSTVFIQQWQDMVSSIVQAAASGVLNQKIIIKVPQPMNSQLISEHLSDFDQFILKKTVQEGIHFKFYNFSVVSIFKNYERKLITRKVYWSGGKKVQLSPIQFSFVYVSPFLLSSLTKKQSTSKPTLKLYKCLAYKNQKVLDLLYRLVDYSNKSDEQNRDEKYKYNTSSRLYLTQGLSVEQFTSKLIEQAASKSKIEPPHIEINLEKIVGDLEIPKKEFMLVVELQENAWVYSSNANSYEKCEYCQSLNDLKQECGCHKVKYCNLVCKNKDWKFHQKNCQTKLQEDNLVPQFKINQKSRLGLVGLSNLGNTCYMNSALQCIIHTKKLTQYFRTNQYLDEINQENPIGSKGLLVKSYAKFVDLAIAGENQVVYASKLKFAIGKTKQMFSGFQQHDSQEFLLFMLDTLHEDLNRVLKKPYTSGVENQGRPDQLVGKESWITYLKRNQSIINDLMGGQYRSQVKCPDCKNISVTFDPFLMFAVPIPSDDAKLINLYFFFSNFSRNALKMCLASKNNSVQELRQDVSLKAKIPIEEILFFVSGFNGAVRKVEDSETVDRLTNEKQLNQNSEQRQLFALQFSQQQISNIENKKFLIFKFLYQPQKVLTFKKPFPFDCRKIKGSDLYNRVFEYIFNLSHRSEKKFDEKERKTKIDVFKTKSMHEQVFRIFMAYGQQTEIKYKINFQKRLLVEESTNIFQLLIKYNYEVQFEVQFKDNPYFQFNNFQNFRDKQIMGDDYETQSGDSGSYTLQQCLNEMKKPEKLLEGNQVFCSKCGDLKLAQKKMQLYKASKYLIIQLRRFRQIGYQKSKNHSNVSFPINLDLGKHLLSPKNPENYFQSDQEFFRKPKYWQGYDNSPSTNYKLYGVVNHHGGLNGGHYTAFGEHENKWYRFDDSLVKEVQPQKVVTPDAYLLFYEKVQ